MEKPNVSSPLPGWFTISAIGALLWELVGCYFYLTEVRMTPQDIAAIPVDLRGMIEARPAWYYAAFGTAVWVGLAGAIGLMLRRRWAEWALLVSLLAAVLQFSSMLIVPEMRNLAASNDLFVPFVVILISYGIWMLARRAGKAGWLR